MLSLLRPVNRESEIFSKLEEYLEKEKIKIKQSCTTSLMIVLISQEKIIP